MWQNNDESNGFHQLGRGFGSTSQTSSRTGSHQYGSWLGSRMYYQHSFYGALQGQETTEKVSPSTPTSTKSGGTLMKMFKRWLVGKKLTPCENRRGRCRNQYQ